MLRNFLDYLRYELNRAPLTIEAYKRDIEQFQNWINPTATKEIDFISVTATDIRAWLSSLGRNGDTPRTLRRKIISLRSFFKWMMKTGKIKHSPLQDISLPKIPKPLPDFIRPEEIEEALQNLKEENEDISISLMKELIIEMLYSLGIRRAELVGLNDSDISYQKGELKVTGKRSKQRVIPLPEQLIYKIKDWQNLRDSQQEYSENDRPLFMVKGKRISPNQVYRAVNKSLSVTSARKKSPHALRHSFASGMLNGGAEIDSVREFLGHNSLATTQIYTHISIKEIKQAYSKAHPRSSASKK